MATTFLLIRHAAHSRVHDTLCGRMPGVTLSEEGRRQAEMLGARVRAAGVAAVLSSPVQRAVETAGAFGLPVAVDAAFEEFDFGAWMGRRFDELSGDPAWQAWNSRRGSSRPPGGESMEDVRQRAMTGLHRLRDERGASAVAIVSHGDVVKAILLGLLGMSDDAHDRIDVAPASISRVVMWDGGARVTGMNEVLGA
ncbi:histidine phosphatase family protein [Roseomonas sp. CCTCC AB2023176]|uniref:histidine phosphatase family protein n=1 Tax=Roseomonas sp. CCTCC AB2023176 TaxID=3342640 RepID=UPI0035D89E48